MPSRIRAADLARYHAAAKLIETDGVGAYHACCDRYGTEIAGVLVVAHLRRANGSADSYPPPDEVVPMTNRMLFNNGILDDEVRERR